MDPSKVLKYTAAIIASILLMVTVPGVEAGKKESEDVIVIAGGGGGGC